MLFVAFKLPNLLRRIFAEGAFFIQAFVPILAEYKSQQGEEATRTYLYCLCIGNADVDLSDCHSNRDSCRTVGYLYYGPGFADSADKFNSQRIY